MMDRLEGFYADILHAIDLIERFLDQGKVTTFDGYSKHILVKSAVETK